MLYVYAAAYYFNRVVLDLLLSSAIVSMTIAPPPEPCALQHSARVMNTPKKQAYTSSTVSL